MQINDRPVIGITPTPTTYKASHGTFHRYALTRNYADAVAAAGGLPLILPYQTDAVDQLIGMLDGILLSGGADLHPRHYGDGEIHPTTYDIDEGRDAFELALTSAALAAGRPIFGICRGIQTLNVALGGSLYQDIADQVGTSVEHRQQERGIAASEPGHSVAIASGSVLDEAIGSTELAVNSFHHQSIRDLAADLEVIATSDDGVIEAVQHRTAPGIFAVQWHPELMFHAQPTHLALFRHLVDVAQRHAVFVP